MGKRTYNDDYIESIIKEYAPKSEDVDLVIEGLHTRLQRAEELRDKWERHANAIPEADCVDSDYRQGFKDALTACVQDYDESLGESHD